MTGRAERRRFTLTEMLVVIAIIIILAGVGIGNYRKISSEMAHKMVVSRVRQVVTGTIQEARRHQVPMQIQMSLSPVNFAGGKMQATGPHTVRGGQCTLTGYWGFSTVDIDQGAEDSQGRRGINRVHILDMPDIREGCLGQGVWLGGGALETEASQILNFDGDVYMEAMVKVDADQYVTGAGAVLLNGGAGTLKLELKGNGSFTYLEAGGLAASDSPFPEDGQWHKVGVSKAAGQGISIYLDNRLIKRGGTATSTDTVAAHSLRIGENFNGAMDEVKVYKLGMGDSVTMQANDAYIYYPGSPSSVTINISPMGTLEGVYNGSAEMTTFRNGVPISINKLSAECTYATNTVYTTFDGGSPSKVITKFDCDVVRKDGSFPQRGYAWFAQKVALAEMVKYEIYYNAAKKSDYIRVLAGNQCGTNGGPDAASGSLSLSLAKVLVHAEPVVLYRNGDVR